MQTRWKKATEKKASVKTDVIIATTSVVKEIVEYAEKSKIDMIVIGSRDVTGFKKLLLGSVAAVVVTYSLSSIGSNMTITMVFNCDNAALGSL